MRIVQLPKFFFWALLVVLVVLVGCGAPDVPPAASGPETPEAADKIFMNGKIITVDDNNPRASAVATRDGKIVYVGDMRGAKPLVGDATEQVDLAGKTLVPGFVDAHGHVVTAGLQAASANLLPAPDGPVNSFGELVATLQQWRDSSKGQTFISRTGWLLGFGFDDSQLQEGVFPTADVLGEVTEDQPLMVIHQSGHFAVMNRAALALVGVDDCTKEVPGGLIRCEADGKTPNGVLEENAFFGSLGVFQKSIDADFALDLFEQGMAMFASFGYTTAQEGRAFGNSVLTAQAKADSGALPIDVALYVDYGFKDLIAAPYYSGSGYGGIAYNNGLRIAGMKMTLDGSPQGKTAWLSHPYFVAPQGQGPDYAGYPAMTLEQVEDEVSDAFAKNRQVLAHCNGDAAIDRFLDAVEAAVAVHGNDDRRTVLIHGQTLRKDQIARLKTLKVMPSLFPMHTFYWGDWHRESVLGPERAAYISPTRDVLDAGLIFSSHHDAPVALPDSMRVLGATVTRVTRSGQVLGPDQRVTPYEGLKAITIWPAFQHFEEGQKGSIEVGKQADFVILSDNPLTVDPLEIASIKVLQTINDGETVYQIDNDPAAVATVVGGDRDAQGCIGSAGYQWCEKLQQCARPWELLAAQAGAAANAAAAPDEAKSDDMAAQFAVVCAG